MEDLPLQADSSFQEGIDMMLSKEHGIDIAVFILWSRLGSPLGSAVRKPDGSPYLSGTEREFDMMLAARNQSGGERPRILAYMRQELEGFHQKLKDKDTAKIEELLNQRKLAEAFVREHFHDEQGHNIRAYHTFPEPITFASRLRVHLKALIDEALGQTFSGASGEKPPYQGLETFNVEHAAIFHGRDAEECELSLLLRQRAGQEGCAFVVVVGASGSGKSSLVRAGLAASLLNENLDDSVRCWRLAVTDARGGRPRPFGEPRPRAPRSPGPARIGLVGSGRPDRESAGSAQAGAQPSDRARPRVSGAKGRRIGAPPARA